MEIEVQNDVCMRFHTSQDAQAVFGVIDRNRAYLRTWLPWVDSTDSPAVTENVIASWLQKRELGTDLVFGIFKAGQPVGCIGLHDINRDNNSAMIGYWLCEDAQGQGIMTACVRALIDYSLSELSLNRIYIHCAEPNKKSRAIPERLGFSLEGLLQDAECLYGTYYDLAVYGLVGRKYMKPQA